MTFDASSWLYIKVIYGTILFNAVADSSSDIFSLKYCLFLLQFISFCEYLGMQLKKLLPLLPQIFQIFLQGFIFIFPSRGSQKLTVIPLRFYLYIVSLRRCYIKVMLYSCYINAFCVEENDSKKAR